MNVSPKSQEDFDIKSAVSTSSCDSSSEDGEEAFYCKTNPLKHKTELCKTFSELGYCNYGPKCRFAHGRHELVLLQAPRVFKRRRCNGFWKNGYCLYGMRCQFGHAEVEWENSAALQGLQAECCGGHGRSRLFRMLL